MTEGLLLAAGAGRRFGMPKALVRDDDGRPWLTSAVWSLLEGGCDGVTVVLGASAGDAECLLADGLGDLKRVASIRAHAWEMGMGASLRAGLLALSGTGAEAALVHLVDLPDVGATVVRRVIEAVRAAGTEPGGLARASYDGRPGHPVLIGRDHWAEVAQTAGVDEGARRYFATREPLLVECGDLAGGHDVDRPSRRG